ncbi:cupin domain-containing protein [Mumia sp. zg.B53]|uniref:cupin domain-containing protein n=1 Tax=Mumia sp. zg.B53 TaxID=2855449 RepID=UPI001C6F4C85|nr:cupin domain-containing protein [Mumia sp. zg.B53]MBW9216177.1 cupin domain-containing protein [Mumia sp. zg.B53]
MTADRIGAPLSEGRPAVVPEAAWASPVARLLGRPLEEFASTYWGREPLLATAAERDGGFEDLLDEDAVDALLSEHGLRTPFLRVARDGTTLPNRDFTAGAGVGAGITDQVDDSRLSALFGDGATLVLQGLHRTWPPLVRFVADLAEELGHPVQANAYVTPPQAQGFDDHYDVHDVFVLQVSGEKEWRIRPPVLEAPLRDQPWTERRAAVAHAAQEPPLIRTVLRPGDCLYLPRGYLHAATALGDVSTHLTLGVHAWTRHALAGEVLQSVLRSLTDDPAIRASLDVGVDLGDEHAIGDDLDLVRDRLASAIADLDRAAVARRLEGASRRAGRPAPVGPVAQLRASQQLQPDDVVTLREHLHGELRLRDNGDADLVSRAGTVRLDAADLPAVRELLVSREIPVGTLGIDLARRLLARAVVVRGR